MTDKPHPSIVLSAHRRGVPEFERFVISDQFLRYWDGKAWSNDEDAALLFADSNAACEEMQRLLLLEHEGKPRRRFRAPVYLDLYADGPISVRDVQAWLVRVSKLLMDSPSHGNGPLQGTLGLTRIEWRELEELDPRDMK